jgi:hypothetical protein
MKHPPSGFAAPPALASPEGDAPSGLAQPVPRAPWHGAAPLPLNGRRPSLAPFDRFGLHRLSLRAAALAAALLGPLAAWADGAPAAATTPVAAVTALAPAAPAPTPPAADAVQAPIQPLVPRVGDATRRLLDLQASGQLASATPRPIPGEQAQRSRARYLKSFEHPIPEEFKSPVAQAASGAGH